MSVRTFDPGQVSLIVGAFPISGFADGTFINVSRENDSFSKVTGADGITSRAKSNDRSGMIVITLAQTSPSNDVLSGINAADELNSDGVVPVFVKDNSGRGLFVSAFAWIRRPADSEFSKEVSNREWTLDCSELNMFVGGNPTAE